MKCGQALFLPAVAGAGNAVQSKNCKINGTVQIFNPIKVSHEMLTVACLFFSLPVCVSAHVLQHGVSVGKGKNKSQTVTGEQIWSQLPIS